MANAFQRWKHRHHQSAPYRLHMSYSVERNKGKIIWLIRENWYVTVREMASEIEIGH